MAVYGLLVGVNQYKSPMVNPLRGCENDVYLFSQTLQARFGIPEDHLKLLLNIEASHQNIIDHFQRYLIDRDWKQHDTAVFYFSGHGAQSLAPEIFWDIEPDHLNESLVCHDSRTPGVPDLLDKELRYLIAQLAKKCGHIAVFLDCCHGGHGTRFPGDESETVRLVPLDTAVYPLDSFVFGQQSTKTLDQVQLGGRLAPDSGKHILLSGCQSFQLSREKPQGEGYTQHGLFTYALCETLSSLQYPISYQELRNRIHTRVQGQNASQSPQIEAIGGEDVTRKVLGGELLPLRLLAHRQKGQWWLNAGVMHGFNTGDEVALFGNDADTSQLDTCLTTARIQQADSFASTLTLSDDSGVKGAEYTAIVTRQNFAKMPVRLLGEEAGVQAARAILQQDNAPSDPGRFLQESAAEARYDIHAGDGVYYVTQSHDTRPLFKRTPHAQAALEQAAVMARWQHKRDLHNPASRLDDPVEIVVTYGEDEYNNEDVTLRYTFDGTKWVRPSFNLELRLKPGQPNLYYALLYFDGSTGGISNVLASGGWLSHESVAQEGQMKAQPTIKAYEGKPIPLKIRDELIQQGITRIQDSLKLMLCEEEFDSSLLIQQELELDAGRQVSRSSLNNTLNRLFNDAHRSLAVEEEAVEKAPDWTTQLINLSVICPPAAVVVQEQKATTLLQSDSSEVRIEPHPAFRGLVRLTTARRENTRSIGKHALPEPAVLSADASVFAFGDGQGTDLGLDALEIFVSSDAGKSASSNDQAGAVSAATPLVLSTNLPLEEGASILPYTYACYEEDGEEKIIFLPLGFSHTAADGRTAIIIEALPESALTTPDDSSRSLGSALKIYFRKLIYRDLLRIDEEIHSLRIPEFDITDQTKVSGYVTDSASIAAQVAAANRILLIVHGIIGHTSTIAGSVNLSHTDGQATLAAQYDLVLTYDYENLSTPVQDIARALKAQLARVGISADSGKRMDIVAHSMGGLVSRWFIEREGGAAMVDRLVMVGTPNGGTPIAAVKQQGEAILKTWAYSNLVAILNGLTTAYVGGIVVAGLMTLLDSVSHNLDQMAPDAELIRELANSAAPANVRYAVIAGDTAGLMIPPDQYTVRLAKLLEYLRERLRLAAYNLLTAKLFGEANDMAVGNSSMAHFNPAWQGAVTVEAVRCDHLSYFQDKTTLQRVAQQLSI